MVLVETANGGAVSTRSVAQAPAVNITATAHAIPFGRIGRPCRNRVTSKVSLLTEP